MAKKKYYAVKFGIRPGIYETWAECEAQTKGFSGAQYKSFSSLSEAEKYMNGVGDSKVQKNESESENSTEQINNRVEEEFRKIGENEVIAFVDGSY